MRRFFGAGRDEAFVDQAEQGHLLGSGGLEIGSAEESDIDILFSWD